MPRPLPLPLMRPPAVGRHRQVGRVADDLVPDDLHAAPAAVIFVFCLTTLPFWPVIVVGIISGAVHRFPDAASAECAPIGRLTVMLETGTSGVEAKLSW